MLSEQWAIGRGEVYVYTTDAGFHQELRKLNRRFATYTDLRGKVFAWQHRVRRTALDILVSRQTNSNVLKNKAVTGADSSDLPPAVRSRGGNSQDRHPARNEPKPDEVRHVESDQPDKVAPG